MPFLNLQTGILLYADTNVENPKIRLADITDVFQQVMVANVKSAEAVVKPGETKSVISTQRDSDPNLDTHSITFSRPISNEDVIRMSLTIPTSATFQSRRTLGVDATTHLSFTRVGPRSMKLATLSGTPMNTSSVVTGDQLWIERNTDSFTNCFSEYNCDKLLTVQSKGVGYIVVNDEGLAGEEGDIALGSLFDTAFKVFVKPSADSPRVADSVQVSSPAFNSFNCGVFSILRITDNYIEFANPYGVDEVATNTVGGITIFDYFVRFLHLVADGELQVSFGAGNGSMTVAPLNTERAQLTLTVKTTEISVTNNTMNTVALRCQSAGTLEG